MKLAILFVIRGRIATSSRTGRTSTLEIDVGDLRPASVSFSETELAVTLADGRKIVTPLDWYPRLREASQAARENYELMPLGIHWPDLDEDLGVFGMLRGQRTKQARSLDEAKRNPGLSQRIRNPGFHHS